MPDELVTLEITLDNGGPDTAAEIVWVSHDGDEQKYGEVRERATVKQETFAGHCWLVRGTRTRTVLLRGLSLLGRQPVARPYYSTEPRAGTPRTPCVDAPERWFRT